MPKTNRRCGGTFNTNGLESSPIPEYMEKRGVDWLVVTETWLKPSQSPNIQNAVQHIIRPRPPNKAGRGHGGITEAINETLACAPFLGADKVQSEANALLERLEVAIKEALDATVDRHKNGNFSTSRPFVTPALRRLLRKRRELLKARRKSPLSLTIHDACNEAGKRVRQERQRLRLSKYKSFLADLANKPASEFSHLDKLFRRARARKTKIPMTQAMLDEGADFYEGAFCPCVPTGPRMQPRQVTPAEATPTTIIDPTVDGATPPTCVLKAYSTETIRSYVGNSKTGRWMVATPSLTRCLQRRCAAKTCPKRNRPRLTRTQHPWSTRYHTSSLRFKS